MNTKEMRNALKSHLSGVASGVTCGWLNVDVDPGVLPRFEMSWASSGRRGGALKGGLWVIEDGVFAVNICIAKGGGEDDAMDYLDIISVAFNEGKRLTYTGGEIVILAPADPRPGYPDKNCYRVPVMVRYRAEE